MKKCHCSNLFLCQKLKSQDLLHQAQSNLGYFIACFWSPQLPSTQSESPLAQIRLASKSHVSFKVRTQLQTDFFFHISIQINCNLFIEGLL
jgi:hypothetical protein